MSQRKFKLLCTASHFITLEKKIYGVGFLGHLEQNGDIKRLDESVMPVGISALSRVTVQRHQQYLGRL